MTNIVRPMNTGVFSHDLPVVDEPCRCCCVANPAPAATFLSNSSLPVLLPLPNPLLRHRKCLHPSQVCFLLQINFFFVSYYLITGIVMMNIGDRDVPFPP